MKIEYNAKPQNFSLRTLQQGITKNYHTDTLFMSNSDIKWSLVCDATIVNLKGGSAANLAKNEVKGVLSGYCPSHAQHSLSLQLTAVVK